MTGFPVASKRGPHDDTIVRMATPMHVFNEIAGRYGVESTDEEAVDRFFIYHVPKLSQNTQQAILDELLARDGEPPRVPFPQATAPPVKTTGNKSQKTPKAEV